MEDSSLQAANNYHGDSDSQVSESSCTPSTSSSSRSQKKKRRAVPIRIHLGNCKYEVLRIVQRKLRWREVGDDEEWELYWTDTSVSIDRIMKLNKTQKINHFHGMLEICRKRAMARNLQEVQRMFPKQYNFFPQTFVLPGDLPDLLSDLRSASRHQAYILKPDAGCQGKGIKLVMTESALQKYLKDLEGVAVVAQRYLHRPFLVNGLKFDLRVYALVLSCDPLRVFVYQEGLVRFCTEKYSAPKAANLGLAYMHLTNYAVNKRNDQFVPAKSDQDHGECGSKWSFTALWAYLQSQGHDTQKVWDNIQDLVVKSLISVQPILAHNYRSALPADNDGFSCFEVLGYDILLDHKLQPWLIEVNHSPSFNIDSPLDLNIKEHLITDTFDLVWVDPKLIRQVRKAEKKAVTSRLMGAAKLKKEAVSTKPASGGSHASRLDATPKSANSQKDQESKEASKLKGSSKLVSERLEKDRCRRGAVT